MAEVSVGFEGRVAIVTGAGSGLGRAYAMELARRGAKVVVNDINGAEQVAAEISSKGGVALANLDSVTSRTGGKAIVACAIKAFGRLDILISNAGNLRHARFEEMDEHAIDSVIDVHIKGAFHVGQPAFAQMKRQGHGRILLTASASGLFGHPWQASYAASKAAMVGLSNTISLEGQHHGICCNVLLPSARTPMANSVDFNWKDEVPAVGAVFEELIAKPTGGADRLNPEWVVPLALFLVSDASRSTHGIFSACSGRYARVAIASANGWAAPSLPTLEELADHWDQVCDLGSLTEPMSVYDEALSVREVLEKFG